RRSDVTTATILLLRNLARGTGTVAEPTDAGSQRSSTDQNLDRVESPAAWGCRQDRRSRGVSDGCLTRGRNCCATTGGWG
ncbi:hypothetical protein FRB97_005162, partial [Tulasnella sp. 331]